MGKKNLVISRDNRMNRITNLAQDLLGSLSKAALALDIALWLFSLPLLMRFYSVPILLKRLAENRWTRTKTRLGMTDVVEVATRVCNRRPFRSRFFPKVCLRQSLTLYRVLSQMGYQVEIHFGALKGGEDLYGHSWVTVRGEALADTAQSGMFKLIYSYPLTTLSHRAGTNASQS